MEVFRTLTYCGVVSMSIAIHGSRYAPPIVHFFTDSPHGTPRYVPPVPLEQSTLGHSYA
jgi:hypothetical protein